MRAEDLSTASTATGSDLVTPPQPAVDARARERLPGLEPERGVTDWGRSERLTALADATVLRFLYDSWHRVGVEGAAHVPGSGGALLVANRAGQLPIDGAMIARAVRQSGWPARGRNLHVAATQTFASVPLLGMAVTKLGGVSTHPADLHRLLFDEQALVLVFPEGARATKPLYARYRLRAFDQVDVVRAAVTARVPIVPVAVLGAEEAQPAIGSVSVPGIGRLAIGPGMPLPAKMRIRFLAPVRTDELEPAEVRDRVLAGELVERIRGLIQENLFEMVAARRSVWVG